MGSTSAGASAKLTGVAGYSYTDAGTDSSENDPSSSLFGYTVDGPGVHYKNEAIYALLRGELSLADGYWTTVRRY